MQDVPPEVQEDMAICQCLDELEHALKVADAIAPVGEIEHPSAPQAAANVVQAAVVSGARALAAAVKRRYRL